MVDACDMSLMNKPCETDKIKVDKYGNVDAHGKSIGDKVTPGVHYAYIYNEAMSNETNWGEDIKEYCEDKENKELQGIRGRCIQICYNTHGQLAHIFNPECIQKCESTYEQQKRDYYPKAVNQCRINHVGSLWAATNGKEFIWK